MTIDAFALPDDLAVKAAPALIAADERHFAAVSESLAAAISDATARLDVERARAGGAGQAALDRDLEIHRLSSRLRALRRFRLDACLGRFVRTGEEEPVYVGRFGLTDADGRRLLVDWRAPAAEPFFAATPAHPLGLESRRRYRWTAGRITDYWDEAFTERALAQRAALDDQSAFIASLGSSRSPRMRDVLSTLQADQDAIIRADAHGALVVDGGPGTGKTVVALHRAAYLLYADPRLGPGRGRVLVVGPHEPYLAYVSDVLPSLGEDGVQTCTVRDLLPEGQTAARETDPVVTALKASARFAEAVEPAVGLYEEPPTTALEISTPWADVRLT
ncbi:MAG: AAA family ATPase, partial [Microbacterium sp.]